MRYRQRLQEEARARRITFRLIGLVCLLTVLFASFGCSTQEQTTKFDALVKVGSVYNPNNIRIQSGNLQIKSQMFENDIGISEGTTFWLDFQREFEAQRTLNFPNPLRSEGMELEITSKDSVYRFIRYLHPEHVEFTQKLTL